MFRSQLSWLVVLGLFMVVSYVANNWAMSAVSPAKQYAGLGLYVVAEAIIFLPLLYIADRAAQRAGQRHRPGGRDNARPVRRA